MAMLFLFDKHWMAVIYLWEETDKNILYQWNQIHGLMYKSERVMPRGGIWVTKTDANGKEQWNMTLFENYLEKIDAYPSSLQLTSDRGYIISRQAFT